MGGKSSKPSADEDQYILVMGSSGAGKTSFINKVSGSQLKVSDDILNCTLEDQTSMPFKYKGRTIRMIDTVGFDDPEASDADLRLDLQHRLVKLGRVKRQLIGIVYLHDISLLRTGNTAIRMINQFDKVIGKTATRNVVIVTTKWDLIDPQVGDRRQQRLSEHPKVFGPLMRKGAAMLKYSQGRDDPHQIIDRLLRKSS